MPHISGPKHVVYEETWTHQLHMIIATINSSCTFSHFCHYMGIPLVDPWNCPCKSIVLPHIGITWGLHCTIHETKLPMQSHCFGITWGLFWLANDTVHEKPLCCHILALQGLHTGWLIKLPMGNHCQTEAVPEFPMLCPNGGPRCLWSPSNAF